MLIAVLERALPSERGMSKLAKAAKTAGGKAALLTCQECLLHDLQVLCNALHVQTLQQ